MLPPARSTGVNLLGRLRGGHSAEEAYLREWARSHAGVEAFVEPRTAVTETTVLLVAADGEWTRRRVAGPNAARRLAHRAPGPLAVGGDEQHGGLRDRRARLDERFHPGVGIGRASCRERV